MPKRKSKQDIIVVYKKLGRQRAYGQAFLDTKIIEVDSRLKPKKELEIIIHEALHVVFPEEPEYKILTKARVVRDTLWKLGYRKSS